MACKFKELVRDHVLMIDAGKSSQFAATAHAAVEIACAVIDRKNDIFIACPDHSLACSMADVLKEAGLEATVGLVMTKDAYFVIVKNVLQWFDKPVAADDLLDAIIGRVENSKEIAKSRAPLPKMKRKRISK